MFFKRCIFMRCRGCLLQPPNETSWETETSPEKMVSRILTSVSFIIVNNILRYPCWLRILCDQPLHASMQSFEFFNMFQRRCSAALRMANQRDQCFLPKKNAVDSGDLPWKSSRSPAVKQFSACVFSTVVLLCDVVVACSNHLVEQLGKPKHGRKMGITHFHVVSPIIVNHILRCNRWPFFFWRTKRNECNTH